MLVGNKSDLRHLLAVPTEDGKSYTEQESLWWSSCLVIILTSIWVLDYTLLYSVSLALFLVLTTLYCYMKNRDHCYTDYKYRLKKDKTDFEPSGWSPDTCIDMVG